MGLNSIPRCKICHLLMVKEEYTSDLLTHIYHHNDLNQIKGAGVEDTLRIYFDFFKFT